MSRPLVFRIEVQDDVDSAYEWYEAQREGLTDLFDCLQLIEQNDQRFGIVYRGVRAGLLNRFPHVVYYRPRKERIEVIAIHHGRRNPKAWRRRI